MSKPISMNSLLPDTKLWAILDRAGFAVYRLRELELARFNLTIEQSSVLFMIKDHGGSMTIRELIDETIRQPNSVYILVNRMVKQGLVSKLERSNEKRVVIAITDKGEQVFRELTAISLRVIFSVLSNKEKVKMRELLRQVTERARELLGIPYKLPFLQYLEVEKPAERIQMSVGLTDTKLWAILNTTRFAVSRLREVELARFDLTIEQSSILHMLDQRGGSAAVQDLIEETMRQPNSVYTLINRMSKMGLVSKTEKLDSKRILVEITGQGKSVLDRITGTSLEMAFSVLSDKDKASLMKILEMLIEKAVPLLGMHKMPLVEYLDAPGHKLEV